MNNDDTVEVMHKDAKGNVRSSTGPASGGSTPVINTWRYDEYGKPLGQEGTSRQPFGYTGQQSLTASTLHLRARAYDPGSAVFLQRDRYPGRLSNPATLNRYAYAVGNPVRHADPSGKYPFDYGPGTGVPLDSAPPPGSVIDYTVNTAISGQVQISLPGAYAEVEAGLIFSPADGPGAFVNFGSGTGGGLPAAGGSINLTTQEAQRLQDFSGSSETTGGSAGPVGLYSTKSTSGNSKTLSLSTTIFGGEIHTNKNWTIVLPLRGWKDSTDDSTVQRYEIDTFDDFEQDSSRHEYDSSTSEIDPSNDVTVDYSFGL
jgi:RHS repeat-associated protein